METLSISDHREYDGRYAHARPADTTAPPILIQLFNPAFAYFSSKVFDPEYAVPDEILRDVQKLRTKFAAIHANENVRQQNVSSLLVSRRCTKSKPKQKNKW